MKTRVLSVRLSYSTIAYCYQLQERAGRAVKGKPVGTIVPDTLEALVEASRRMYNIPDLNTAAEAEAVLQQYVDTIPGFEPVKPMWGPDKDRARDINLAIQIAAEQQSQKPTPAAEEKTSRADEPQAIEPPAENDVQPQNDVTEGIPEYGDVADESQYVVDAEAYLASAIKAEMDAEEQELAQAVSVGNIERVSPDTVPAVAKCPWEGTEMLSVEDVANDAVYKEALSIDWLMGMAVRVVYKNISSTQWSSELAIKLVKKTYKSFKEWEEANANH